MLEQPGTFISVAERDARIEPEVLTLIDSAYQTERYDVMVAVNDAILAFNSQLIDEFSKPVLKHSMYWHKLGGSSPEHSSEKPADEIIAAVDERVKAFALGPLKDILES